jgi:hypothetical protein
VPGEGREHSERAACKARWRTGKAGSAAIAWQCTVVERSVGSELRGVRRAVSRIVHSLAA